MDRIAIVGATGSIGEALADTLRAAGRPYRAIARSREALERAFGHDPLAEAVVWDPADPASVKQALAGCAAAVYLVGVDYTRFDLHPVLMQATIDGAIAAGVERMLLVGTVYSFGRPQSDRVREDHPREPQTFKGRMRKLQEDLLLAADRRGDLRATILRLPDFYGPGSVKGYASDAFRAAALGGVAQVVGPVDRPHEYFFVPDAGGAIARLLDEPRAFGRAWNLGGSGAITPRAFCEKIFAAAGKRPRLFVIGRTMLRLAGAFNPAIREVAEMQYLFETPVIVDDAAITALLGNVEKTPYDEGIARTLASFARAA